MVSLIFIIFVLLWSIKNSIQLVKNCGRTQHKLGLVKCGDHSRPGDYPWLVSIHKKESDEFACNGHLISNRHVLTAGSCLYEEMYEVSVNLIYVVVGRHSLKKNVDEAQKVEIRKVQTNIPRSLHDAKLFYEIVLITLDESVTFSQLVQPICILSGSSCTTEEMCTGTIVRIKLRKKLFKLLS